MSETIAKVNGLELKTDSLYQIMPKKDDDAPEYYTKNGTSKLLMQGISAGAPCLYDQRTKSWDTGFHEKSPCYRGWKSQDVVNQVKALQKHIVEPFEELREEGTLSHKDTKDSFWLSFGASNLWNGRILNTNNPEELLELYIAALHGHICTRDKQNDPRYKGASYTIENKDAVVGVREERKKKRAEAITSFGKLLETNKDSLKEVMLYLGLPSTDDDGLLSVVMDYVENPSQGHNNAERLLDTIKKASTKTGAQEINIYSQLHTLFKKGVIRRISSEYYLDDNSLGMDLKSAAAKVKKSKPLKDILAAEIVKLED